MLIVDSYVQFEEKLYWTKYNRVSFFSEALKVISGVLKAINLHTVIFKTFVFRGNDFSRVI